jgi:hypothetical protein
VRPRISTDRSNAIVTAGGREVALTNLDKVFWLELDITKGALLQRGIEIGSISGFGQRRCGRNRK